MQSTLLYPILQNALRSWGQQPLGKTWDLQCQNGAMTRISRKTKSCRQHALFLWPVKLMLRISNLFLHLIEITHFQKYIDGLLTYMTCRSRGKIYSHVKNNFEYTLLIYPFIYYFFLPNRYIFKERFLKIFPFFLKKWYSIMSMLKIDTST